MSMVEKESSAVPNNNSEVSPDAKAFIGKVFGNCEVLNPIGSGAMGRVYKGFHKALHIEVAIKILRKDFAAKSTDTVENFLQEARSAAKLRHENIIGVFDVGTEDDNYFIIMEYAKGNNLADLIRTKKALSWKESLPMMKQICLGLQHAHKHKVIHRDIKPENILLTTAGDIKVADLGLSKSLNTEEDVSNDTIVGTPNYISPEQLDKKMQVDHRCDIYSMGCTFFHMLAGQPPYKRSSLRDTLLAHINDPIPDVRDFATDVNEKLSGVIKMMMEKDPEERFSSAKAVYDALRAVEKDAQKGGDGKDKERVKLLKGTKILVVEDSLAINGIICKGLRFAGAEAVSADNGSEALSILMESKKGEFDLVMTDIQMPVMSGKDLIREVRSIPNLEFTPILVLSGVDQKGILLECINYGIEGYLNKPCPSGVLVESAVKIIEKSKRANKSSVSTPSSGVAGELAKVLKDAAQIVADDGFGGISSYEEEPVYAMFADYMSKHYPDEL